VWRRHAAQVVIINRSRLLIARPGSPVLSKDQVVGSLPLLLSPHGPAVRPRIRLPGHLFVHQETPMKRLKRCWIDFGSTADLYFLCHGHDWRWCLRLVQPKVVIKNEKMDYATQATAGRAATIAIRAFGLRIRNTYVNGAKVTNGYRYIVK